jgi:cell division septal protein FtsQ
LRLIGFLYSTRSDSYNPKLGWRRTAKSCYTPIQVQNLRLPKAVVIVLSSAAVLAVTVGVYRAIHSPLFTVQVVEVTDQVSTAQAQAVSPDPNSWVQPWTPVDPQIITDLAAVPVGQANLFDLDLSRIEKRILENDWVREVRLQKRFPQTLSITTVFREPKAVIQLDTGALSYVDAEGKVFGKVSLEGPKNLPILTHVDCDDPVQLKSLLTLLNKWEASPISKFARIESMNEDAEKGYRLMISYVLDTQSSHILVHARVDMGHEASTDEEKAQFTRLTQVLDYLHAHSISARQIFADSGKKIVVKTAHGS